MNTASLAITGLAVAAALFAADSPAPPVQGAQVAAAAPAAAKKKPDEMVCKSIAVTGSRVVNRICMTRAEWTVRTAEDQEFLGTILRGSLGACASSGC
jgi:hypothetical protein